MILSRSRSQNPTGNRSRDLASQAQRARTEMAAKVALGHMLAKDKKRLRNAETCIRKNPGSRKARRLARLLSGSYAVKVAAMAQAARKTVAPPAPGGTGPRKMCAAEVIKGADQMRPNAPTSERVTMRVEAKRSKRKR